MTEGTSMGSLRVARGRSHKEKNSKDQKRKPIKCFLCDGLYYARDCLKKNRLLAISSMEEEEPTQEKWEVRIGALKLLLIPWKLKDSSRSLHIEFAVRQSQAWLYEVPCLSWHGYIKLIHIRWSGQEFGPSRGANWTSVQGNQLWRCNSCWYRSRHGYEHRWLQGQGHHWGNSNDYDYIYILN